MGKFNGFCTLHPIQRKGAYDDAMAYQNFGSREKQETTKQQMDQFFGEQMKLVQGNISEEESKYVEKRLTKNFEPANGSSGNTSSSDEDVDTAADVPKWNETSPELNQLLAAISYRRHFRKELNRKRKQFYRRQIVKSKRAFSQLAQIMKQEVKAAIGTVSYYLRC